MSATSKPISPPPLSLSFPLHASLFPSLLPSFDAFLHTSPSFPPRHPFLPQGSAPILMHVREVHKVHLTLHLSIDRCIHRCSYIQKSMHMLKQTEVQAHHLAQGRAPMPTQFLHPSSSRPVAFKNVERGDASAPLLPAAAGGWGVGACREEMRLHPSSQLLRVAWVCTCVLTDAPTTHTTMWTCTYDI